MATSSLTHSSTFCARARMGTQLRRAAQPGSGRPALVQDRDLPAATHQQPPGAGATGLISSSLVFLRSNQRFNRFAQTRLAATNSNRGPASPVRPVAGAAVRRPARSRCCGPSFLGPTAIAFADRYQMRMPGRGLRPRAQSIALQSRQTFPPAASAGRTSSAPPSRRQAPSSGWKAAGKQAWARASRVPV